MQKIKNFIKRLQQDQRGYGMAELMLIIALLGMLAIGVSGILQDKLTDAADSVGDNVNSFVDSWDTDTSD